MQKEKKRRFRNWRKVEGEDRGEKVLIFVHILTLHDKSIIKRCNDVLIKMLLNVPDYILCLLASALIINTL